MTELAFPDVTLLVTHYNRSGSLDRLLSAFRDLNVKFGAIVVSDDGSRPEHRQKLNDLSTQFGFELVSAEKNKGLGNNINKGQDAVKTPYTLYVQEDFVPKPGFSQSFSDALSILRDEQDVDIIRFYAYFKYPYTRPFGKGFSEMLFSPMPWYSDHLKFYLYSDHPHLRRSDFFEKFGRYPEGIKGDDTEFTMCLSFLKRKARGLIYDRFNDVFDQKNSADEPSTMLRSDWRQKKNPLILVLRALYLKYRFAKNTVQFILHK